MAKTTMRITTRVRYRGLKVTVLGDSDAGLLAVAGYQTAHEQAIAAIAVKRRAGRRVYCIAGASTWTNSITAAAAQAVRAREAIDRR